jgi:hypothetical protein
MHTIIIGSTRCGTTSLYNYLGAHPQIKTAKGGAWQEIHFFDYEDNYKKGIEWYKNQFPSALVTVDSSPTMLQHKLAPQRVFTHYSMYDIKLIVLLRNPIERAYSDYWLARKKNWIAEPFEISIAKEPSRLKHDLKRGSFWKNKFNMSHHHLRGFIERGMYAKHLREWMQLYDNIKVIRSEDLYEDTQQTVNSVFRWLGVQDHIINDRVWHKGSYSAMRAQTREQLKELFRPHNLELEKLLDRSFYWK